jgi:hypothetical protein
MEGLLMGSLPPKLLDPKLNFNRHTTTTKVAREVIKAVKRCPGVTRILVGRISWVHSGRRAAKEMPLEGGIGWRIHGDGAIQELWVFTSDPSAVRKAVKALFAK